MTRHLALSMLVVITLCPAGMAWAQTGTAPNQESPAQVQPTQGNGGDGFFDKGGGGGSLSKSKCESANQGFLIEAGAVILGAVLLFHVLLWLIARQNWLKSLGGGNLRFFVVLLPFMLAGSGLVWYFRATSGTIARCIASSSYKDLILAAGWDAWIVGVVFGAVPILVLAFLVQIIRSIVE